MSKPCGAALRLPGPAPTLAPTLVLDLAFSWAFTLALTLAFSLRLFPVATSNLEGTIRMAVGSRPGTGPSAVSRQGART